MNLSPQQAEQIARQFLHGHRLDHSYGTAQLAAEFALQVDCDRDLLYCAGMVHDICKPLQLPSLLAKFTTCPQWLDPINRRSAALLHGPAAAIVLSEQFGVDNRQLLDAVRYHTTGSAQLDLAGVLLYLADFLDPERSFPEQAAVRSRLQRSIKDGLTAVLRFSFNRLIEKQQIIHPLSVQFYNRIVTDGFLFNSQPLHCS